MYQILIAKSANQEHYFEGLNNYCALQKDAFGFDTVINRIPFNYTNEVEKGNNSIKAN